MRQQVAILAAGRGTRLGRPHPKPLTRLGDGRSILGAQLDRLRDTFGDPQVYVVVGYKLEMILEEHAGDAVFVYNEDYDETNTAKSLLKALRASNDGGVLWLNGDVVFDDDLLGCARPAMAGERSFIAVNTALTAEEEVKYTVDADGAIRELSKTVRGGRGEAIGVNYVADADKAALIARLTEVGDADYFERAVELTIASDGVRFDALDVSARAAVEVDTAEDLARANAVGQHPGSGE